MNDDSAELQAPGWNAIDQALRPIYGDTQPMHWGTIISWRLGGPDPIHGISAYRSNRSRNHLHYVTYGFSELWEKESNEPNISGFGFELTFRLAHDANEPHPDWVLNFLQNLGRHVFQTGHTFGPGHSMPLNGPIAIGEDTKICAISFSLDPEMPPIDTPNGHLAFLQIVGLTDDELYAIEAWNASRFLEFVQEQNELLITDLRRDTYLANPSFADRVQRATVAEGASAEALCCGHASFQCKGDSWCQLTLGAAVVGDLARRLVGRIPYGRPFSILTDSLEIRFEPGDELSWAETADGLRIMLTAQQCQVFVEELLNPHEGIFSSDMLPGLSVIVQTTIITDDDGNVVREIG